MIFNFFKKAPLKSFIPEGFVDIHNHVLPSIDDGSQSMKDTSELLDKMHKELNFSQIIATPHTLTNVWDNTTESIQNAYYKVQQELPKQAKEVALRAASEYYLDQDFVERLMQQPLLTLKDNYVLVELSYLNPPVQLNEILFEIVVKGYIPVLAHPERYLYYHKDKTRYESLKHAGCLFQLNLLSTTGYYGKGVMDAADYLLKSGMIDFTGSDIHNMKHVKAFDRKVKISATKELEKALDSNQLFKI